MAGFPVLYLSSFKKAIDRIIVLLHSRGVHFANIISQLRKVDCTGWVETFAKINSVKHSTGLHEMAQSQSRTWLEDLQVITPGVVASLLHV